MSDYGEARGTGRMAPILWERAKQKGSSCCAGLWLGGAVFRWAERQTKHVSRFSDLAHESGVWGGRGRGGHQACIHAVRSNVSLVGIEGHAASGDAAAPPAMTSSASTRPRWHMMPWLFDIFEEEERGDCKMLSGAAWIGLGWLGVVGLPWGWEELDLGSFDGCSPERFDVRMPTVD